MMGIPTVFVRTVGCNLRCSWCDTQYSMDGGNDMAVSDIMAAVGDAKHVCVTGGEPLLQEDMPDLLRRLMAAGKQVVLETNGSVDLKDVPVSPLMLISMDIKCPSSGMTDKMMASNLQYLSKKDQLKFIIRDQEDFDFASGFIREHPTEANIIFGPVGGTDRLEWLVGKLLDSEIEARVLPQLHKIIWGDRKSV